MPMGLKNFIGLNRIVNNPDAYLYKSSKAQISWKNNLKFVILSKQNFTGSNFR